MADSVITVIRKRQAGSSSSESEPRRYERQRDARSSKNATSTWSLYFLTFFIGEAILQILRYDYDYLTKTKSLASCMIRNFVSYMITFSIVGKFYEFCLVVELKELKGYFES